MNRLGVSASRSGRPSKITPAILEIVEQQNEQMLLVNKTTAVQLQPILVDAGHPLSRMKLGWTLRGSAYCQIIHDSNKAKRLEWV